jgi:histidinol-phosphate aminotransferase
MIDVRRDAGSFGSSCRREQILVGRPFPPLTNYVRLTIGTLAEMEEAVPAMLALLQSGPSARIEPSPRWAPGFEC